MRLQLHIQPRASRTGLAGKFGDALKIRLRSAPVDGAANEELIHFLAERLGVSRQSVVLISGHSARRKVVQITGVVVDEAVKLLGLATE